MTEHTVASVRVDDVPPTAYAIEAAASLASENISKPVPTPNVYISAADQLPDVEETIQVGAVPHQSTETAYSRLSLASTYNTPERPVTETDVNRNSTGADQNISE